MSYCNHCHLHYSRCSCHNQYVSCGCPVQLDFSCVIYHKGNNEVTELDALGLSNGATLELFAETVDEKLKQLNVLDLPLPCLRAEYVVNNLQQFMTAVDTELCEINATLPFLGEFESGDEPEDPQDGQYWTNEDDPNLLYIQLGGVTRSIDLNP